MALLELSFASGEDSLSVRRFSVHEVVSSLFTVSVWARSPQADLDLEALVGKPASFRIQSGLAFALLGGTRHWTGVCSYIEQIQPEPTGLSTYYLRIVPTMWLLTQRRNYRVFQHLSIPDIADRILSEWHVPVSWRIDRARYPKLDYKVQYGESDHAFLSRLLEEAGIASTFPDEAKGTKLLLGDALHLAAPRATPPIHWVDNPNQSAEKEFVTRVRLAHEVRPAAHTIRDHDFRKPGFALFGKATAGKSGDASAHLHEQYHYQPGAFLIETAHGGGTPVADDQGVARHDGKYGTTRAEHALAGARMGGRSISFETNAIDLRPGVVFSMHGHPHAELPESAKLLVTELTVEGSPGGEWSTSGRAVFAEEPYRPPLVTPKPEVSGVQSATVVGPKGQEIHTDEFGRVRVQFPWDREGKHDDHSSCWIRVSQGWAGTGFGMITLPRIGQEVMVGFVEGDPDHPIVVGRVFNAMEQVPYKLPEHKTRSTWKSDSSIGSGGFNEIMFEDLKGKELVYVQAQKNLRKLVKHDETITVGRNRQKFVMVNETETTGANRTEITGANRTEITGANRTTVIGGNSIKLVKGDETEKTDGKLVVYVGGDQDIVVKQTKRERIEGASHLVVKGKRNQKIGGTQSLTVGGNQQEKVGKNHALEAGEEIHLKAGSTLVIEAAHDLTLKGPGGFIRIDASGVTIKGTMVKINSGGSAGSGKGSSPEDPEEAEEAVVEEPEKPVPDNVLISGLAQ
jgi:type VI secretion system secreted protein VgrG